VVVVESATEGTYLVTRKLLMFALISFATICMAEDPQSPVPGAAAASQRAARPRQIAVGQRSTDQTPVTDGASSGAVNGAADGASNSTNDAATAGKSVATADAPKFVSEAKWVLAGYNSDEIVYTVFVTNQDPRIIRCTTEVKGFYFENGSKLSISDRQITTVFPNQPTRVGYWMDMDQQSGATYSVKCHPV
jgi:hypothetical protein